MEPEVGAVPVINERSKKLQLGNVFDRLYNHAEKSGGRSVNKDGQGAVVRTRYVT